MSLRPFSNWILFTLAVMNAGFPAWAAQEPDPSQSCVTRWGKLGESLTETVKKAKEKHAQFTRLPYLQEPAFQKWLELQDQKLSTYFKDTQAPAALEGKGALTRRIQDLTLDPKEMARFDQDLEDFLTLCERVSPYRMRGSCGYDKEVFLKWWKENKGLILNRGSIAEMNAHSLGTLIAIHYPEAVKKAFLEKNDLPWALKTLVAPFQNHYVRAALKGVGKPVHGIVASLLATAWFTMKFTPTQVVVTGFGNPILQPLQDKSNQEGQSGLGDVSIRFKEWLMGSKTDPSQVKDISEFLASLSEEARRVYETHEMSPEDAWKNLSALRSKWIALGQKFNQYFPLYEQLGRTLYMEQIHEYPGKYAVAVASFDHYQKDYEESEIRLKEELAKKYKIEPQAMDGLLNHFEERRLQSEGLLPGRIEDLRKQDEKKTQELLAPFLKKRVPEDQINRLLGYREGKLVNLDSAAEMFATWMLRHFSYPEADRVISDQGSELEDVKRRLGFYYYRRKFMKHFLNVLRKEQVLLDHLMGASEFYSKTPEALK